MTMLECYGRTHRPIAHTNYPVMDMWLLCDQGWCDCGHVCPVDEDVRVDGGVSSALYD